MPTTSGMNPLQFIFPPGVLKAPTSARPLESERHTKGPTLDEFIKAMRQVVSATEDEQHLFSQNEYDRSYIRRRLQDAAEIRRLGLPKLAEDIEADMLEFAQSGFELNPELRAALQAQNQGVFEETPGHRSQPMTDEQQRQFAFRSLIADIVRFLSNPSQVPRRFVEQR